METVCLGHQGQKWEGNPGFLRPGPVFFSPHSSNDGRTNRCPSYITTVLSLGFLLPEKHIFYYWSQGEINGGLTEIEGLASGRPGTHELFQDLKMS